MSPHPAAEGVSHGPERRPLARALPPKPARPPGAGLGGADHAPAGGGGPASLIAFDAESFRDQSDVTRQLVDLWFAEEKEHSRLLSGAVARFGGTPIDGHWSFWVFCQVRRWLGVRFELTALLLTEIVSTAYYRLLRRHGEDTALRQMCRLVLRDEAGHVAFHRDRLARQSAAGRLRLGGLW